MTKTVQGLLGLGAVGGGALAGVVLKSTLALNEEHIYINLNKRSKKEVKRHLTVLHFTDVHLGMPYSFPRFEKMVNNIQNVSSDIVVCTGDLIDNPKSFTAWKKAERLLGKINAPMGKYAIWGNHEKRGKKKTDVERMYHDAGVDLLCNQSREISLSANRKLCLYGIDDILEGKPDLSVLPKKQNKDVLAILLLHEPDAAKIMCHYGVDVILAGHSHGGQILFPKMGAVVKPLLAQKMVKGLFTFNGRQIYVNSGLGTTAIPFRLLCEPQYSVLHIEY